MCDRIGCRHLPDFRNMDLSGKAVPSRRKFLKAAAATSIAMAAGPGLIGGPAMAAGGAWRRAAQSASAASSSSSLTAVASAPLSAHRFA